MYFPLRAPELPLEQRPAAFIEWCSTYYKPLPEGTPITAETVRDCIVIAEQTPTLLSLTPNEYERMVDPTVLFRSGLILTTADEIHQNNTRRTFLDADAVLSEVDVIALWCDRSIWLCLWGEKVLEDLLQEKPAAGKRKRRVSVLKLANANHFVSLHIRIH